MRVVMGDPGWAADASFATADGRRAHAAPLDEHVADWTRAGARDELAARLQDRGVPAAPMLTGTDMGTHPHYRASGFAITIDQQELGPMVLDGAAFRGELMVGPDVRQAPAIGEHTRRIATELLGLDDAAVDRLLASGVLETTPPVVDVTGDTPG
jgi:crotonobetainyl-CoA:carnitine CoA-transferase CaiB-like acyl-CoA transferase